MKKTTNNFEGRSVTVKPHEDFNKALRRFKKKVQDSGVLQTVRENEYYEKPTTKRKREKAAGVARYRKQLRKEQERNTKKY